MDEREDALMTAPWCNYSRSTDIRIAYAKNWRRSGFLRGFYRWMRGRDSGPWYNYSCLTGVRVACARIEGVLAGCAWTAFISAFISVFFFFFIFFWFMNGRTLRRQRLNASIRAVYQGFQLSGKSGNLQRPGNVREFIGKLFFLNLRNKLSINSYFLSAG